LEVISLYVTQSRGILSLTIFHDANTYNSLKVFFILVVEEIIFATK
jgi:hypothetical protein